MQTSQVAAYFSYINSADVLSREHLGSELSKLGFWFCGPKFLCTKFQFDSVGQNSCLVDHAGV